MTGRDNEDIGCCGIPPFSFALLWIRMGTRFYVALHANCRSSALLRMTKGAEGATLPFPVETLLLNVVRSEMGPGDEVVSSVVAV